MSAQKTIALLMFKGFMESSYQFEDLRKSYDIMKNDLDSFENFKKLLGDAFDGCSEVGSYDFKSQPYYTPPAPEHREQTEKPIEPALPKIAKNPDDDIPF